MKLRGWPFILACIAWSCVVCYGLWALWAYEAKPSPAPETSARWPDGSSLRRAPEGPTLVMLAHPKCPCTRASVGELAELVARCNGKLTAYVLFIKPGGVERGWEKTDLWRSAAAIPGVKVVCDEGGDEARRFGAESSGHTLLYDDRGQLVFSGGITAARGHYGDNDGLTAVVSLVRDASADRNKTFVFGCSLFDDGPRQQEWEGVRQ